MSLLLFGPFALGAVHAWSEFVLLAGTVLLTLLLTLRLLLTPACRPVRTWAYVPMVLFIGLAFLQVASLSSGLVGWISPKRLELESLLLQDLPRVAGLCHLSFYTYGTLHHLRMVFIAAATFAVVVHVCADYRSVMRAMWGVVIVGLLVSTFAIFQDVLGNGKIYWTIATQGQTNWGPGSGPFVNYNNFCQYITLTLGCGLGLLLAELHGSCGHHCTRMDKPRGRVSTRAFRVGFLIAAVFTCGLSIPLSLSRGGVVGFGLAAVAVGSLLAVRERKTLGPVTLWAILAILLLGMCLVGAGSVLARFHGLAEQQSYLWRVQTAKDLWHASSEFPFVGTGLGTLQFIYPLYKSIFTPDLLVHADSAYPELLIEAGWGGVMCVAGFVGCVWWSAAKAMRSSVPAARMAAYGLGIGLLGVMLQSITDCGQYLPAIAMLSAVTCGLLVCLGKVGRITSWPSTDPSGARCLTGARLAHGLAMAGVTVAGLGLLRQGFAALAAERAWRQVSKLEAMPMASRPGTPQGQSALLRNAQAAVAADPGNVEYASALACYRWRTATGSLNGIDELASGPSSQAIQERGNVVAALQAARRLCPTFAFPVLMQGRVEFLTGVKQRGADLVRKAWQLDSHSPEVLLEAGVVEASLGNTSEMTRHFERLFKLDPSYRGEIFDVCLRIDSPELALEIVEDDPGALLELGAILARSDRYREVADDARSAAREALEQRCSRPGMDAWDLATLARLQVEDRDLQLAAENYGKALDLSYANSTWHWERAKVLLRIRRLDEAERELRICLRLQPNWPEPKRMLEETAFQRAGDRE